MRQTISTLAAVDCRACVVAPVGLPLLFLNSSKKRS